MTPQHTGRPPAAPDDGAAGRARHLLLDFDGPMCRLFAEHPARGIAGPPGLPSEIRGKLEQAFAAALADPAFLREAERASLPLRPLVGPAYRDMAAKVETTVRALWKVRPWSG